MNNFESLNLSENLNLALAKMNFSKPTPIQAQTIPFALQSKDILGSAQTGTGKTAAFCIPMVDILSKNENMTALIMTPTRELARQVLDVVNQLIGYESSLRTACLIGGEAMGKQLNQLRKGPRIIVGTPGRINDHLERETLDLMDCGYLVLDETDRMLDMGFGVQIDQTLQYMPSERQTLLFSATLPAKIMQLSKKYLHNPERIAIESDEVLLTNISHEILNIDHNKKYVELLKQLSQRDGSVLIFAKTKHGTQRMAKNLTNDGFKADALNGNLNQNKRDKVMSSFRSKKFKVLVATDIASRGLDVDHIEHVINYDLPQVAEDYVHRIGRTGRAGSKGSTICFISPEEQPLWDQIDYLLNPKTAKKPSGSNKSSRSVRKRSGGQHQSSRPGRSFSTSNGPRRSGGPRRSSEGNTDSRPSRSSGPRRSSEGNTGSRPFRSGGPRRSSEGNTDSRPSRNSEGNTDSRPSRRADGNTGSRPFRSGGPRRSSEGNTGSRPFRSGGPRRSSEGNTDSRPSRSSGPRRSSEGNTDSRPSRNSSPRRSASGNTFARPNRGSGQNRNTSGPRSKTLGLRQGSNR
ncbi:DEAD/DEAH box helicase [Gammaproteobacteria bacterium]|nr:DEAD/DEAH box helicase [Gammaproteobacteria bacterium]